MPSQVEEAIDRFRTAMLAEEAKATQEVLKSYAVTRETLLGRIAALEQVLQEAGSLTPSEALRLDRAQELLRQVEAEMVKLARESLDPIQQGQRSLVDMAVDHALDLTMASVREASRTAIGQAWNRVNTDAVEALVGRIQEGAPLNQWMGQFGPSTASAIEQALRESVALGRNPRATAEILSRQVDVAASRLLTTTRTAQLNAYRDATLATYQANADILEGWVWTSAHNTRTCLSCLSLDGTLFPLDKDFMPTHPNCRCRPVAEVEGEPPMDRQTGAEWFADQPASVRREMLPMSAVEDYESGRLRLGDFVHLREDEVWGDSYVQASVKTARANAVKRGVPEMSFTSYPVAPRPLGRRKPAEPDTKAPKKRADPIAATMAPAVPEARAGAVRDSRRAAIKPKHRLSGTAPDTVLEIEDTIRKNSRESAHVFDRDGNLTFTKKGNEHSVGFTDAEVARMKDGIFTHNHPSTVSGGFSRADFLTTRAADVLEMRAIASSSGVRSILRRPEGGWGASKIKTGAIYDREFRLVKEDFEARIRAGTMTVKEANDTYGSEVTRRAAKELGWTYEEFPE